MWGGHVDTWAPVLSVTSPARSGSFPLGPVVPQTVTPRICAR